ncbi:MAG: hypothetical protein EON92_03125 [Burkholderiales bacterium]|nr:MAG: hypothetical protein EON92_03125 [Burkholderiales bacterium]
MMGVLLNLATEHCVLRDQVKVLETLLASRGLIEADALAATPDRAEQEDSAAFAEALLRPLLGVQQASGATGIFSLATRRGER